MQAAPKFIPGRLCRPLSRCLVIRGGVQLDELVQRAFHAALDEPGRRRQGVPPARAGQRTAPSPCRTGSPARGAIATRILRSGQVSEYPWMRVSHRCSSNVEGSSDPWTSWPSANCVFNAHSMTSSNRSRSSGRTRVSPVMTCRADAGMALTAGIRADSSADLASIVRTRGRSGMSTGFLRVI